MPSIRRFAMYLLLAAALQAARAENLLDIANLAATRDPQFRSIEASYQAVKEQRVQARANLMLPRVEAGMHTEYNDQDITSSFSFGTLGNSDSASFNSRGWSINLRQPVYHYDRWIELKQADSRIVQADLSVSAARQDVMIRASERYFEVLAAQDDLEFARAEKTALARQLEQAQQRFEVGLIAITDVQEAQAGYDAAVAQEILAQNSLDNAFDALSELTGQAHNAVTPLGEAMPLATPEPAVLEQWTETALKQNLKLRQAIAAADTAEQEITRQRAGHHPSLDVVGSRGDQRTGGRFGQTDTDAAVIGLELTVPIYAGGQIVSRTREAEHRHRAALEDLERERRAAERTTRTAYLGIISGVSRVKALAQAVVSAQTAVTATAAGFEVGTRTSVDVVTAERELFRSKRDYARARYDYILNTLRLKQAAGTLATQDVATVNSWLAPR
ncbi:MAG: TolC family outer membrane protein [Gammaproteobacteria bacterium]